MLFHKFYNTSFLLRLCIDGDFYSVSLYESTMKNNKVRCTAEFLTKRIDNISNEKCAYIDFKM